MVCPCSYYYSPYSQLFTDCKAPAKDDSPNFARIHFESMDSTAQADKLRKQKERQEMAVRFFIAMPLELFTLNIGGPSKAVGREKATYRIRKKERR